MKSSLFWNQQGNLSVPRGKFKEACRYYSLAILGNPYEYEYWNNRGYVYYRLVKHKKSMRDLQIALELKPKNLMSICVMGHVHSEKHQYDKALESYSAALEIEPNDGLSLSFRATVYYKTHQYDKALEDLFRAVELSPDFDSLYLKIGGILLSKYKFKKALEYFFIGLKHCVYIEYNKAIFHSKIAICYAKLGEHELAMENIEKAKTFDCAETTQHIQSALSTVYFCMKDYTKSLRHSKKSFPNDYRSFNAAFAYCKTARVLMKLERYDEAKKLCDEAFAVNKMESNSPYLLGVIHFNQKDMQAALRYFNKAIKINQQNYKFFRWRGLVFRRLGMFDESMKDLNRSIELLDSSPKSYKIRSELFKILAKEKGMGDPMGERKKFCEEQATTDIGKACTLRENKYLGQEIAQKVLTEEEEEGEQTKEKKENKIPKSTSCKKKQ